MKKYVLAALAAALLCIPAFAQNSASGNISASSTNCFSVASSCVWESVLPPNAGTTTIALSGTFSATLPVEWSNDGGKTWATAATLSAVGTTTYSTNGFTDIRVRCSAYTSGTAVVTISTGLLQVQSVVSGSSSSSPSSPAPPMGYYLSSACKDLGVTNALCFTTPADTQIANDCAYTSGLPDVTCSTAHFVSTDCVGGAGCTGTGTSKRIFAYLSCVPSINLAASNNNPFTTGAVVSIASFISPTHITATANAANTVTVSVVLPQGGCVVWGHPDDAGAAAVDAAIQSASYCARLDLASANYWFNVPHFYTNPTACKNLPSLIGQASNAGTIVYSSGFEWSGRGDGTTTIFMPPGFPESGTCTNGLSGIGCWVVVTEGSLHDIQFTGGGNRLAPNVAGGSNIFELDGPATLKDVVMSNFGGRGGNGTVAVTCIGAYLWTQLNHVNPSGCGTRTLATNTSSSVTAMQLWVENFGSTGIYVGFLSDYYVQSVPQFSKYNFICYDCTVSLESAVDPFGVFMLVNKGLKIKWYRGALTTLSFNPPQSQNNVIGYDCLTTAGCELDMEDAYMDFSQPATGTGYIAINQAVAGTVKLKNTLLGATAGASGGRMYTDVAGSLFQNLGGNTVIGGSTTSQFVVNGKSFATSSESGTVTCATSAATITFVGTYLFNPSVVIQDQTTAGAVTQTSLSTTTKVVGCPGATDVLNYTVTPNPI